MNPRSYVTTSMPRSRQIAQAIASNKKSPFNNTTTLIWELPFGRDRRWGSNLGIAANALLGGWRVTAINTMTSGAPVNLSYSPAANAQVSGVPTYRPNISGDIYASGGQQSITNWFDTASVIIPTDSSQPFGNAPRNAARGPAIYVLDLGLHKSIPLVSRSRMEFRVEVFNLFNRSNFATPNGNRSSTAFGTITSLATTPRQVQLGVKVDF